jgi:hypothetical protein
MGLMVLYAKRLYPRFILGEYRLFPDTEFIYPVSKTTEWVRVTCAAESKTLCCACI